MSAKRGPGARPLRFWEDEGGPTATEYAILLAVLVLVAVAAIQSIGQRVYNLYDVIDTALPTN